MFPRRDELFGVITVQTTLKSKIIYESPFPRARANAFYLCCSFWFTLHILHPLQIRNTISSPPPPPLYFLTSCRIKFFFSPSFISITVWFISLGMFPEPDCFLPVLEWMARPLTLMPNQRPACFSAPFRRPPPFPRGRQSFRVYSMLQCQSLCERRGLRSPTPTAFSFSVFVSFFGKKKHTVQTISFTW